MLKFLNKKMVNTFQVFLRLKFTSFNSMPLNRHHTPYAGFLLFQILVAHFGCVQFPLTLICMSFDGMKDEDLNLDIFRN